MADRVQPTIDWERPWERQEGESAKLYGYYQVFQRLSSKDRSIRRAYQIAFDKPGAAPTARFRDNATRWQWVKRAASWDDEQARVARETETEQTREMVKRHAGTSLLLLQKVVERVQDMDAREIPATVLPRYFETAVRVERISRGLPTDATVHSGDSDAPIHVAHRDTALDLSDITAEQARMLLEIRRKVRGESTVPADVVDDDDDQDEDLE